MNCSELKAYLIALIVLFVVFVVAAVSIIIKLKNKVNDLQKSYEALVSINECLGDHQPSEETDAADDGIIIGGYSETTEENTTSDESETVEKTNIIEDEGSQYEIGCAIEVADEEVDDCQFPECKEDVKREIDLIIHRVQECPGVSELLLNSAAYGKLKKFVEAKSIIPNKDVLWNEIDDLIEEVFPGFRKRLAILFARKFREPEIRVLMLMKFGFKESQTARMANMPRSNMNYYKLKVSDNPHLSDALKDYGIRQIIYHL